MSVPIRKYTAATSFVRSLPDCKKKENYFPITTLRHRKWAKLTLDFIHALWKSGDASKAGICMMPATRLTDEQFDSYRPYWSNAVFGCTELNRDQLDRYGREYGRHYT